MEKQILKKGQKKWEHINNEKNSFALLKKKKRNESSSIWTGKSWPSQRTKSVGVSPERWQ